MKLFSSIVVTGASSGIGAALAEALVARDALVAVSARSADVLESRFGGRARIEPLAQRGDGGF